MWLRNSGIGGLSTVLVILAQPAQAQRGVARDYDLPAQPLGEALRQVAVQSGQPVIVQSILVAGLQAPPLIGRYDVEQALAVLLQRTGLRVVSSGDTLIVERMAGAGHDEEVRAGTVDIIVTGTRIRGQKPVGSDVITIDRATIERNGFATTQQIAQSIPQNFAGGANEGTGTSITGLGGGNAGRGASVNLRGLGQSSTLVLLNGDRPPLGGATGTFADLSMIPAAAIERIEIVADGASAIYGSDAVAGVVNIIPRLNFTGAETSVRIGTADGDAQEYVASQVFGGRWSGGQAMMAIEFYRRDHLPAGDRGFATDDLRTFGGPDSRGPYANPGTILAGGTSYAIPRGQNGVGLRPDQLVAGTVNLGDSQSGTDLLPFQRRQSVFAAVSQDIAGPVRFYARGLASFRRFDQAVRSSLDAGRLVPVTNPFYVDPISTGAPVRVQYDFGRDLGREREKGLVQAYGGSLGLDATLGGWKLDGHGTWGRQSESYRDRNLINSARLALALADTNPATAYNLFGDGPSTNQATIDAVRGSRDSLYDGTVWSLTARADGPVFRLPAGAVRFAAGVDYRTERYRERPSYTDVSTLTPTVTVPTPLLGRRTIKAIYGELLVPLFCGEATLPGLYRLDISAALRAERYSDFGDTTNPKIGFTWQPVGGMTLRGSYGQSFRAPLSQELRQDPGSRAVFAFLVPDPQAATGQSNVLFLVGNGTGLRPERATTWTIGADLKPAALPGFHGGVTWFNVDYRDRIVNPASQLFGVLANRAVFAALITDNPSPARVAQLFASSDYRDFSGIPATATFAAVVDGRTQNLSVVRQSGLDFDLAYAFDALNGGAEIGAVATQIWHIRQGLTPTAPTIDVVNTTGNPVDLRLRGRATWENDMLSAALYVNYVDGYENRTVSPAQPVSSWTTVDLNVAYRFKRATGAMMGVRVALNATNLFDRDPPFLTYATGVSTSGYDAENANPLGRVVSLQVTKSW